MGNAGAGKTALLLRFCDNTFTDSFISTIGVDFKVRTVDIDGETVKLQIWDSYGSSKYVVQPANVSAAMLRTSQAAIICYDVTDPESFSDVRKWVQEVERYGTEDIVKILVGCKNDLVSNKKVDNSDAQELADSCTMTFIETSAKTSTNIEKVFLAAGKLMKDHLGR